MSNLPDDEMLARMSLVGIAPFESRSLLDRVADAAEELAREYRANEVGFGLSSDRVLDDLAAKLRAS